MFKKIWLTHMVIEGEEIITVGANTVRLGY